MPMVGTVLHRAGIEAVHPDRTFAHPTNRGYDFFVTGTGTPAIFTLNMPRLVRVQK